MTSTYAILDPSSPPTRARRLACALAMMIKAPRPGASKTRLVPPLTHEEAAALSVCFLRDTAANIAAACAASASAARGVAVYTPVGAESAFDGLLPADFALLAQRGAGFGERLFHAADDLLRAGFDSLCLIDSDSPTLPTRALAAAVEELAKPGERVVLGAADDGGYYLIGIKSAHRRLFERIDWSTERVAAQTIERAAEINLPVALLPAWYDVDDAATLSRLCRELFGAARETKEPRGVEGSGASCPAEPAGYDAPHTRDFLARLIEREGRGRVWNEPPPRDRAAEANDDDAADTDGARGAGATS
ncbi:MAG: TIGR04282 family arsenosugar biosynthesis glycosyltransferase [Pyrinomonadaceae bacterium]